MVLIGGKPDHPLQMRIESGANMLDVSWYFKPWIDYP
jgi:hypothetical protein